MDNNVQYDGEDDEAAQELGAVPAGPQSKEMMNTISAEHPGVMTLSDHDAQFAIDPPGGFDPLEDLLVTISEALCVREVLPRVSQIANRVLRHDGLELVVRDQDGQVTMQARLPDGLPPTACRRRPGSARTASFEIVVHRALWWVEVAPFGLADVNGVAHGLDEKVERLLDETSRVSRSI